MASRKFPILGTETPPMVGRKRIMQKLVRELTKMTPSHLSLVGPRFSGKSVILNALTDAMKKNDSQYLAVVSWDLGHSTPHTDAEFMRMFARQLGESLQTVKPYYAEFLLDKDAGHDELREVASSLANDGDRVLVLWDGFDRPLSEGNLTRDLWDSLLDLFRKSSLRVVTCTRKELHKLIRDEDSGSSDFWGIFESSSRIGPFDDDDLDVILGEVPKLNLEPGAKTELMKWSGGVPVLLLESLNRMLSEPSKAAIDNKLAIYAARSAIEACSKVLDCLWDDCGVSAQDAYRLLVEKGEVPGSELSKEDRKSLFENGFAREEGNGRVRSTCRMLQDYVQDVRGEGGIMARLFGTQEDYRQNVRGLLERRLNQIAVIDERLHRLVQRSIEDLPDYPEDCLNNMSNIEDKALDLIWGSECDSSKRLLQEVIDCWTTGDVPRNSTIKEMMDQDNWTIPNERGKQVGLLQLLTGSRQGFESKAKYVSKNTYVLVNAIHSFRNRGQHGDGEEMQLGVAVAGIMSCIELLGCLGKELQ